MPEKLCVTPMMSNGRQENKNIMLLQRQSLQKKKINKCNFSKFALQPVIKMDQDGISESFVSFLCDRQNSLFLCSCSFSFPLLSQTDLLFLTLLLSFFFLFFYLFPLLFSTCLCPINIIFSQ